MAWTPLQKAAHRMALKYRGLCTRCARRRTGRRYSLCGRCRTGEALRWHLNYATKAIARQGARG